MKVCPWCSQVANEDATKCFWCGQELTAENVFVIQRKIRALHDPASPRCSNCKRSGMSFVANQYQKLPVRAIYLCPTCQTTVQTTNYVATVVYASGYVVRFAVEVLKGFGGGGG